MLEERNAEVRPLSARSVVASTLLAEHPPRLRASALVRAGEAFGISEGSVRVALSRMVAAGELIVDEGRYELSGHLVARQRRQDQSLAKTGSSNGPWDGMWLVTVVVGERRSAPERSEFRAAMLAARYRELREGVWMRPANLDPAVPPAGTAANVQSLLARPTEAPEALAARLWDLHAWQCTARRLFDALHHRLSDASHDRPLDLAESFMLDAAVLRHFQSDPLLPTSLLPSEWPGEALRDAYRRFHEEFLADWREWQQGARPK